MIGSNVLTRIFFIKANLYGTAFSIDVDGREYLVTAKHLLDLSSPIDSIKIFWESKWTDVPVQLVGACRGQVDIAVLAVPERQLSPGQSLEPTPEGMVIGQDLFFVGYPYKMWTNVGDEMGGGPLPFVRKGALASAMDHGDGTSHMYIDAINNEGFSGAPVVFDPPENEARRGYPYRVSGVVAKYRIDFEKVLDENGDDTKMTVAYNTGFTIAYSITYALALIRANPIGRLL
jgi:hypothetical protein